MYRTCRFILFFVLLVVQLVPGDARGTSAFSMVLIGERVESGDVRAIALGGSTQLLTDSLGVLHWNPALLTGLELVSVGATQLLAADQGRSSDYNERDNSYLFPTFRAAFPIADWFVLSVGYMARYDPDGSFETGDVTKDGEAFVRRFTKSGGLFAVPFTVSRHISRYASLGLTISLERGFVEERWDTEFEDPGIASARGLQKADFTGTGVGGGVVLRPLQNLMIGGSYEGEIDYDTDVVERFSTRSGDLVFAQPNLDTTFASTARLPARASAGITWGVSESVLLAASFAWSDFADFEGLGFPTDRLGRENSYAFGVEYDGVSLAGRQFPVRLSFNYQELPFEFPVGEKITKFLVGFGTGFTILEGRGKFDLALQAGKVGAISDNGLEDRLFRMYIGVSGGERWRRKVGQGI